MLERGTPTTFTPEGDLALAKLKGIEQGVDYRTGTIYDTPGVDRSQRKEVGAEFEDPRSGAGGRVGATGFGGTIQQEQESKFLSFKTALDESDLSAAEKREATVRFRQRQVAESQLAASEEERERNRAREQAEAEAAGREGGFGFDFTDTFGVDVNTSETYSGLNGALAQMQSMDSDVSQAFMPLLQAQFGQLQAIEAAKKELLANVPSIQPTLDLAAVREKQLTTQRADALAIADENKRIQVDAADLSREMASLDKEIIEQRQIEDEQKLIAQNTQNEKVLRRRANKMGIETDTNGLDFVMDQVSQGERDLANLRKFNNLTTAKLNLAIGRQYKIDIDQAINGYESMRLTIDSNFNDRINELDNSITKARSDIAADKRKIITDMLKERNKLELDLGETIKDARIKMYDAEIDAAKDEKDRISDLWDEADDYIDNFGTQNKEQLAWFEKQLGLQPGGLSGQKTLAELRMKKTGSGTGGVGGASSIENERASIGRQFPGATPQEIDNLVKANIVARYGNNEKARAILRDAEVYMREHPINGEFYEVEPIFNTEDARDIYNNYASTASDRQGLVDGELDPEVLYEMVVQEELQEAGKDISKREREAAEQSARDYVAGLGVYEFSPGRYSRQDKWVKKVDEAVSAATDVSTGYYNR